MSAFCVAVAAIDALDDVDSFGDCYGPTWQRVLAARLELCHEVWRAYDETAPGDLDATLLSWLARRPTMIDREAWWARLGEGPRCYATEGHAILVLEQCDVQPPDAFADATTVLRSVDDFVSLHRMRADIAEAFDQTEPWLLVGGWALLDLARLVRPYACVPARIAGDATVLVEYSGPRDPVRFSGTGWGAIIMPNTYEPEAVDIFELEPGCA